MIGSHLVREARLRAGLSQAELAARTGTTQSAIARLERGRSSPGFARVDELVTACGFELRVGLTPIDAHDRNLTPDIGSLTPEQRFDRARNAGRFILAGRAARVAAGG